MFGKIYFLEQQFYFIYVCINLPLALAFLKAIGLCQASYETLSMLRIWGGPCGPNIWTSDLSGRFGLQQELTVVIVCRVLAHLIQARANWGPFYNPSTSNPVD